MSQVGTSSIDFASFTPKVARQRIAQSRGPCLKNNRQPEPLSVLEKQDLIAGCSQSTSIGPFSQSTSRTLAQIVRLASPPEPDAELLS
jgi:hypothetical protein